MNNIIKAKSFFLSVALIILGGTFAHANWVMAPGDSPRNGSLYLWIVNKTTNEYTITTEAHASPYFFGDDYLIPLCADIPSVSDDGNAEKIELSVKAELPYYYISGYLPDALSAPHYKVASAEACITFINKDEDLDDPITNYYMSKNGNPVASFTKEGSRIIPRWHVENGKKGWLIIIKNPTSAYQVKTEPLF